jgi:hypothetical protein
MSNEIESKVRSAIEKGKPLLEAVIADLEREANLIKERDLDPRKLAEEPRVQEARSSAVEALEYLTGIAKTLDSLGKSYAEDLAKRVDVEKIKQHMTAAPAAEPTLVDDDDGQPTTEQIEVAAEDAKADVAAETEKGKAKVEAVASKAKEDVGAVANKAKSSTKEMLAALGWLAAAGAVVYVVFMDEKRRRQAKSVAKAAGSGIIVVANSASRKN